MAEILTTGFAGKWGLTYGTPAFFLVMVVCAVASYLLGSINFAVVFSKAFRHDDVRTHGSGNAGSTNMLRTFGLKMALLTLFCDVLKGALATLLGLFMMPYYTGFAYVCALCCMLGHAFPVYYGFKGGKCVATFAGAALVINPPVWILLILSFVLIVYISRYVSLGSVVCAACFPLLINFIPFVTVTLEDGTLAGAPPVAIITSVLMAALVIILHRQNIVRLWQGKEAKISFKKKS